MTILISACNSSGIWGRCDKKCYNAATSRSHCHCICKGVNHGAGLKKAQEKTREKSDQWIADWKKKNGADCIFTVPAKQLGLF